MEQPSVSSRTYQLLDMSDSGSSSSAHIPPLILTSPRKKRYRKFGNNRDKFVEKVTFEKCRLQSRTVCVFFVLSVLIVWLLTMSLFINALQNELDKFNHTIITSKTSKFCLSILPIVSQTTDSSTFYNKFFSDHMKFL